jgi:hypothetical protein
VADAWRRPPVSHRQQVPSHRSRVCWCKLPLATIRRTPTSTASLWTSKPRHRKEKCSPPSAPFFPRRRTRKPSAPRALAWATRHCGVRNDGVRASRSKERRPQSGAGTVDHKLILRAFSCCGVSQSDMTDYGEFFFPRRGKSPYSFFRNRPSQS